MQVVSTVSLRVVTFRRRIANDPAPNSAEVLLNNILVPHAAVRCLWLTGTALHDAGGEHSQHEGS